MQSSCLNIAVIDFSSQNKKLKANDELVSTQPFLITENISHVSVLGKDDNLPTIELLAQKDFIKNLKSLHSKFDLIFLCADNNDAISLLSALEGQKTPHITVAKTKKTKSSLLSHMRSLLPIQGLLYD